MVAPPNSRAPRQCCQPLRSRATYGCPLSLWSTSKPHSIDLQAPFDQRHQVASVFQVAVLMDSPKSSAASASSSSVVSVHSEADPTRPRACRNSSRMMSPAQRVRPFPAYLETELATRRG